MRGSGGSGSSSRSPRSRTPDRDAQGHEAALRASRGWAEDGFRDGAMDFVGVGVESDEFRA